MLNKSYDVCLNFDDGSLLYKWKHFPDNLRTAWRRTCEIHVLEIYNDEIMATQEALSSIFYSS